MAAGEKRVFIVHGHNLTLRDEVKEHIASLGLEPVILTDQANRGETVVEKFEHEAATAAYAVILLTGDDKGASAKEVSDVLGFRGATAGEAVMHALINSVTRSSGSKAIQYLLAMPFRARQNVILEPGFFIGRLGRRQVCVLADPDVETPSDIIGIITISTAEDWKDAISRELHAAGVI